jgi:hypothetical protein
MRELQRNLRRLGYLKSGIDGNFGPQTALAVKALQYDLLHNVGNSRGGDGSAPVRVVDYNRGRVLAVTGEVDQKLLGCIADMIGDALFPKLPLASDPTAENAKVRAQIADMRSVEVPMPFLLAIFKQESGCMHYREPSGNNQDNVVVVGCDTNSSEKHIITSRGYGVGQYTLFHHPPTQQEVGAFIVDPAGNVQRAVKELREKFDGFVNGATSGTRADDRIAEAGRGPLRVCRYPASDPRYLRDCRQCAVEAGTQVIRIGQTPLYAGSSAKFQKTQYYANDEYRDVPIRKNLPCDWPYAVRRYNGAGINSYHYQARVLRNVLSMGAIKKRAAAGNRPA